MTDNLTLDVTPCYPYAEYINKADTKTMTQSPISVKTEPPPIPKMMASIKLHEL